jgi:hypothetical protein
MMGEKEKKTFEEIMTENFLHLLKTYTSKKLTELRDLQIATL